MGNGYLTEMRYRLEITETSKGRKMSIY